MEKYVVFMVIAVIITGFMQNIADAYEGKCFENEHYKIIEKKMQNNTKNSDKIFLLETPRRTHKVANAVLKIILEEVLNYTNVDIAEIPLENEILNLHYLHAPSKTYDQKSLRINSELWSFPDSPVVSEIGINEGTLTDPGRYGLFYPTTFGNVDFSTLKNPSELDLEKFQIPQGLINSTRVSSPENNKCENQTCIQILGNDVDDKIHIEQLIKDQNLLVEVLWISNFTDVVNYLYHVNNQSFIVLYWSPSDVINSSIDFTPINLPNHKHYHFGFSTIGKYYKIYDPSSILSSDSFKLAIKALQFLKISEVNFTDIFQSKDNQAEMNLICQIAKDVVLDNINDPIFEKTIVTDVQLLIGGLYPQDGTNLTTVFDIATNVINKNRILPSGFVIKAQSRNGKCKADEVLRQVIQYFNANKVFGIIGPACSETIEPIAGISKFLNIPIISYAAEAPAFNEKMYPYTFRTVGSNRQYEDVFIQFFNAFKWRRFATITEEGQKSTEYIVNMEKRIKDHNIASISDIKVTMQMSADYIRNHLQDLKNKRVKVILAHVRPEFIEVILCEAYNLEMTSKNKYVWFLPSSPSTNSSDCTPDQIEEVLEGHFSFIHKPFNKSSKFIENFMVNNSLCELPDRKLVAGCNYYGFAFDAMMTYAIAANKLISENRRAFNNRGDPDFIHKLTKHIWETDFEGVSGRVRFGEGNSRITNITILQWSEGKYQIVGEYKPLIIGFRQNMTTETGFINVNRSAIVWSKDGNVPEDGTFDCNYHIVVQFLGTDCDNELLTMVILSVIVLVVLICLAYFVFLKRRYHQKLRKSAKYMKNFGIDILSPTSAIYNTLDKWELPKDSIVINRRLGEGEFGTVFGGEAKFPHHDEWIAVAVKSLKCGATNESKLDFLSEAEAMKRFNHEHILKLLGVSLRSEPIYTIMEYMLYGDLKTFLLARRHMIHEKIHDDSDIHPKQLTQYAIGIAKALKYLGENRFVHRDVACRNVLLGADRVAKLGDFGMARSTHDNDYYRFNRKGLLPVRWMAPESLALSVYTPSSDIWSYGVLLYEIITFGSFPYQGLTNRQALECIVSRQILTIPSDVKPQLEKLIKACWNQDSKYRPKAADIIALMEQLPLLVSPCLDVPISSVEIHENDEPINVDILAKMGLKKIKPPVIVQMSTINNLDNKKPDANGMLIPMQSMNVYPPIDEEEDDVVSDLPPSLVQPSSSSTSSSSSSSSSTANNSDAASEKYTIEANDDYCPMMPLLNTNEMIDKSSNGPYGHLSRPSDFRKSEHGH